MTWFSVFVAFHALLIVLLALNVSRLRIGLKIAHGDGGSIPMKAAIRAHGNAIEHVPIFALLVLALALEQAGSLLLGTLVCGFAIARILHVLGMLGTAIIFRRIGALGSYLLEVIAIVALLIALV